MSCLILGERFLVISSFIRTIMVQLYVKIARARKSKVFSVITKCFNRKQSL